MVVKSDLAESLSRRGLLIIFIVLAIFVSGVLINTEIVMSSQLSEDIHVIMEQEVEQTKIMETFIAEKIKSNNDAKIKRSCKQTRNDK